MGYHFTDSDFLMGILDAGGIKAQASTKKNDLGVTRYVSATYDNNLVYHLNKQSKLLYCDVSLEISLHNYKVHEIDYDDLLMDDKYIQHILRKSLYITYQNSKEPKDFIRKYLDVFRQERELVILSDFIPNKEIIAVHYYPTKNDINPQPNKNIVQFAEKLDIPIVIHEFKE